MRRFLLATCVLGCASLTLALLPTHSAVAASNPIVVENQQPGSGGWQIGATMISDDTTGQIKGYASATSVAQGGALTLYVTVNPAQAYSIDVYRLGWYGGMGGRLRQHIGPLDGVQQPPCAAADPNIGMIACKWASSYSLAIPSDWTSGVYVAFLQNAQGYKNYVKFVVRDGRAAGFVYQEAVTTDQAYNNYPADGATGKSLYTFNSFGPNTITGNARAAKVSFDRPVTGDGAGALLNLELNVIRWLEKNGYDVTYTTDVDTHENGAAIRNSKSFISAGHDEYWSKAMFDAVLGARDAGVNLAFLAANAAFWQIRFEPSAGGVADRVIVCYKDASLDPVSGPTTTVNFRAAPVNRPEQLFEGSQYTGEVDPGPNVGYVVTNSTHWAYAGTGVKDGDVVPSIVGYEMDRYMPDFAGPSNARTQTLLSHSPFIDNSGGADYATSSLYQTSSGALVFAAGTMDFAWGLDNYWWTYADPRIQRMTANIFNAFLNGPPVVGLNVTGAATVNAGQPFNISVGAVDAQGTPVAEYMGTVHFATSDTSSGVVLPADATLAGGHGTFSVTLTKAGSQTVTVSDAAHSFSATVTLTVSGQPASRLHVTTAATPTPGTAFPLAVAAEDAYGNADPTYAGTIHFTASDSSSGVVLPADAPLTNGQGAFSATLIRSGAQTITATDTTKPALTGALAVTVGAAPATTLQLSAPTSATAGQSFSLSITALDTYGNVATQYAGRLHFTSTDTAAGVVLPVDSTLTNGQGSFFAQLVTAGSRTIAASDAANSLSSTANVAVGPAPTSRLVLATGTGSPTAGAALSFSVTAQDAFANTTPAYAGRVHFTTDDTSSSVALPADTSLTNGQGSFSATLITAGSRSITGRDTATASISGNLSVNVLAGTATSLQLVAPSGATAGQSFNLTVTASDAYGNAGAQFGGQVHFASTDTASGVALPADSGLTNGRGTFSARLIRAGAQTITAADAANGFSSSANVTVNPASTSRLVVATGTSTPTAGSAFSLAVTAQDAYANTTPAYAGRVHFTSSDTSAGVSLPADGTLASGQGSFSATLTRAGAQTVTATDAANGGISGNGRVTVRAAAAATITMTAPSSVAVEQSFDVGLTFKDRFGNVATGYTGTVHFTSSDLLATLPSDYTFSAGDGGVHTFQGLKLTTPLNQSITVTDTANGSLTATATITVNAPPALGL